MKRGIILLAAVLSLTSCGGFDVDMAAMETDLEAALADDLDVTRDQIAVDCPSSIEWAAGDDFRCQAEDEQGNRAFVIVRMQNDDGEYAWEIDAG